MSTRRGICSTCGPIDLTSQGNCAQRNRKAKQPTRLWHQLHIVRNGICSKCGPVEVDALGGCRKRRREYDLYDLYGLEPGDRDKILQDQNGKCGICGTSEPGGKGWHLDHDHNYAMNDPKGHRGLLCHKCNKGLGQFNDDPDILRKAIIYLERPK